MNQAIPAQGDPLEARIRSWLSEEGYPLEFATAAAFRQAGFTVRQGEYTDPTGSSPPREVDVVAHVNLFGERLVRVQHVVECKWSGDKPWVLFCGGRGITAAACITQSIGSALGETLLWKEAGNQRLASLEMFSSPSSPAFGGRQAFSKTKDVLFDAVRAVTGNCRLLVDEYDASLRNASDRALPRNVVAAFPVIVVDGRLFEARQGTNELELTKVQHSRVHWRGSERHKYAHSTIDVVRSEHLAEFAMRRAAESKVLLEVLSAALAELEQLVREGRPNELSITEGSRGMTGYPPLMRRLVTAFERAEDAAPGSTLS